MWDFFETVRHRHSVRRYQADMPVEDAKLHAILETACAAPSAGDLQAYRIHVLRGRGAREALCAALPEDHAFILQAPLSLVFCADRARSGERFGVRGERLFAVQDATIAASYAQLAAVAAGLASAWVGRFDVDAVRALLHLDANLEPVAALAIGYPAELPALTPRRRLDEIVSEV